MVFADSWGDPFDSADPPADLAALVPPEVGDLTDHQRALPRIARDPVSAAAVAHAVGRVPTRQTLLRGDARDMRAVPDASVHLIVTSPPYWTLKRYRDGEGQLGHIEDYARFVDELDHVWRECFRVLAPGGRLVVVVGDVCLSRRSTAGRHYVMPLHATITERCRAFGFDNLAPIIWHKIANAAYEADGNGGGFLGKPYEPNAVIKNDIEFILMQRKPGGYRSPSVAARVLSVIPEASHRRWFQQIWAGLPGASTRDHPAPYPVEPADRLVRTFSFVGDTVLDPFAGTGTTLVAAAGAGRHGIGYEIDPVYADRARERLRRETASVFRSHVLHFVEARGAA